MRVIFVTVCVAFTLSTSNADAKDKCGGSDAKYYDQAIAFHLAKRSVPYRITQDGSVCVAEQYSSEFVAAEQQVQKYFHEVAYNPKDSCEARAFIDWATNERLRFDMRPSYNSNNQPAGNMFFLRSFTYEEVVLNSDKLANGAPKGATCKPSK